MDQEKEEIKEINQELTEPTPPEVEPIETDIPSAYSTNRKSKKNKKSKKKIFLCIFLIFCLLILFSLGGIYFYYTSCLKPISDQENEIIVTIEKGSNLTQISNVLEENGLIRDARVFRYYVKHQAENDTMQAGTYKFYTNMNISEILEQLNKGSKYYPDLVNITFVEGKNIPWIANKIASSTNNSYDDVMDVLENDSYIDTLIEQYWFLTDEIKNESIYYPLEGYLFPDTYSFKNADVTVETIFETMLDQMDKKLTPYRSEIENSNYTVHEILSLASVIESEGANKDSRSLIASVFYNRLDANMSLGSDVTTYYAIQVDMSERDLYRSEINQYNPYNTRGPNMNGKLPIGPIACSSIESIKAAIEPAESDYLFFVADRNGEIYFTRTNEEHVKKVDELKAQGLWYNYE